MPAYLLLRDLIQSGPYSFEELKVEGILATDLVWIDGISTAWRYPDEIRELQAFVSASSMNMNNNDLSDIAPYNKNSDNEIRNKANDKTFSYKPQENKIQSFQSKTEDRGPIEVKKHENNENISSTVYLIKVIIADDHTLFREGVKMVLSQKTDVEIIGEAENGMQLLHLLKHKTPDVILLDIQMPVMDGISALISIRKRTPDIKVIMLSMHNESSMVTTLMETGANAYLTKTADSETIYEAIKTCYTKAYYFNDLTNMSMLESLRSKNKAPEISPKFESARPMVKMIDPQKKPPRRASKKIKKSVLIAFCSILLVASGIMSITLIRTHPTQIELVLPQRPKQAVKLPVPVNLHQDSSKKAQLTDTAQKINATDSLLKEKTNQALNDEKNSIPEKGRQVLSDEEKPSNLKTSHRMNDKKGLSNKQIQIKKTDSLRKPALPVISKIDSNYKSDNAASSNQPSSTVSKLKEVARNNIFSLVTASVNNYQQGTFDGLSNIELTINNRSIYTMDQVTVEIQYMLLDSNLYKTETLNFQDIPPGSSKVMKASKSSRFATIKYNILSIKSKELEL